MKGFKDSLRRIADAESYVREGRFLVSEEEANTDNKKSESAEIFWESIGAKGRDFYLQAIGVEDLDLVNMAWSQLPRQLRQHISREMNYQQGKINTRHVAQKVSDTILRMWNKNFITKPIGNYKDWDECKRDGKTDEYCGWLEHHAKMDFNDKSFKNKLGAIAALALGFTAGAGGYIMSKKLIQQLMSGGVSPDDLARLMAYGKSNGQIEVGDKVLVFKDDIISFITMPRQENIVKMSTVNKDLRITGKPYHDKSVLRAGESVSFIGGEGILQAIKGNYGYIVDGSGRTHQIHLKSIMRSDDVIYTFKNGMTSWDSLGILDRQEICTVVKVSPTFASRDWNMLPKELSGVIKSKFGICKDKQGDYKCQDCGDTFADKKEYDDHKQAHKGKAGKKCPNCGENTKDGKYCLNCGNKEKEAKECPKCGKKTMDNKYCLNCGYKEKSFKKKVEKTEYKCNECGSVLGNKEAWESHKKNTGHFWGNKVKSHWECYDCSKLFNSRSELVDHLVNYHNRPRDDVEDIIVQKYHYHRVGRDRKRTSSQHMKSGKCPDCGKRFYAMQDYADHRESVHGKDRDISTAKALTDNASPKNNVDAGREITSQHGTGNGGHTDGVKRVKYQVGVVKSDYIGFVKQVDPDAVCQSCAKGLSMTEAQKHADETGHTVMVFKKKEKVELDELSVEYNEDFEDEEDEKKADAVVTTDTSGVNNPMNSTKKPKKKGLGRELGVAVGNTALGRGVLRELPEPKKPKKPDKTPSSKKPNKPDEPKTSNQNNQNERQEKR